MTARIDFLTRNRDAIDSYMDAVSETASEPSTVNAG
jgi:hypothetical protein